MSNATENQKGSLPNFTIPKKLDNGNSVPENGRSSMLPSEEIITPKYPSSTVVPPQDDTTLDVNAPTETKAPLATYRESLHSSLPKELKEQFQPLFCKLCNAQLNSNVNAHLHYKSKKHESKVRKYMMNLAEEKGEPGIVPPPPPKKQKLEEDKDPKYFHCDVCDLPLTGRLHAESHYMGRNHQKALTGKAPAGKGRYNEEGKWVRNATPKKLPVGCTDNFGLAFIGIKQEENPENLHCSICDVNVTSSQQMELHMNGLKHKKKVKMHTTEVDSTAKVSAPEDSVLNSLSSAVSSGDLSVYKTPSGFYYCNNCNLTLNSEMQFKQHLGSKKHRKKATTSKDV